MSPEEHSDIDRRKLRWSGLIATKQHRHGTIPSDLGDERPLVLGEKSWDGRQRLNKDLRHFLAREVAGGQDERGDRLRSLAQCVPHFDT